jgi:micrococcal nuclease
MFTYTALITNVVDGDTIDATIDCGFSIDHRLRLRLTGIDTAETHTPYGKATKVWLEPLLEGRTVTLKTYKPDKYGRYLAAVYLTPESVSVNDQMVQAGVAKGYFGDTKSGLWTPEELAQTVVTLTLT